MTEIEGYFRKASDSINLKGYTKEELEDKQLTSGARKFKKGIGLDSSLPDVLTLFTPFALFGAKTTKTLDEIVNVLQRVKMVSSEEEGKSLVNEMIKTGSIAYTTLPGNVGKRINFEKIYNSKKKLSEYRISCEWMPDY